ncbi:MAG TPA: PAS domain-containing protein, partial [Burkholderiales bacterium]|nr:PAS domain-containing protein [Burkholderiales bacterium]
KKGYEAGGIDYFTKPFDPDILKMKVAAYASFRQRAIALAERERQVRESQELLRVGQKLSAVLRSLPVGVLIADTDGRICQATEEVSRIFKSAEPAESDSYAGILEWWDTSGRVIKDAAAPLSRALHLSESSNSEPVEITCLDGSTKTILVSASPLRGIGGRIVGAVVLIQDLTETTMIEKDLADRVTRLVGLGVELEQRAAH